MASENLSFLVGVKVLRNAGATTLHANYAWENDQGELSGPWATNAKGQRVPIPPPLYEGIEEVIWKELERNGHEYGEVRIDLDTLEGTHEGHA